MNTKYKYEDFEINFDEPLGKGGFGEVYKGKEKSTEKVYAIKRFSNNNLNEDEIKQIEEEEMTSMNLLKKYENSINFFIIFKKKILFI